MQKQQSDQSLWERSEQHPSLMLTLGVFGIVSTATINSHWIDLRLMPMYFVCIALMAWTQPRVLSGVMVVLTSVAWSLAMFWGGRHYEHNWVWWFNGISQILSFGVVWMIVLQLKAALQRAQHLSRTDYLTGLANSRAFYEQADALLSLCRRKGWPVSVAFIDLDHFKRVNDVYGHARGDELLRHVAGVLNQSLRDSDLKARMGGDEFVVLLPDADVAGAEQALLKVLQSFHATALLQDTNVTPSIGLVCAMDAPHDLEKLLRAADDLMYDVKAAGRNSVKIKVIG